MTLIKFGLLVLGSAFAAVLGIARHAFETGEDPSDDGPRALIAEFIGCWVAGFLVFWSFFVPEKNLQWILRGIAVAIGVCAAVASVHFGSTDEVPETPDKEPTGFKSDKIDLHLE